MGNKIVHFEIPVQDTERMSRFYSELFGWKFAKAPMEGMEYWLISTAGDGSLGGGMYRKMQETDKPRFYMQVENIDEHTERFKKAGGTVIVEKQEVPGTGFTVIGADPEGNAIGLFQPTAPPPQQQSTATNNAAPQGSSASRRSSSPSSSSSSSSKRKSSKAKTTNNKKKKRKSARSSKKTRRK